MTGARALQPRAFASVVSACTGAHHVERAWLRRRIDAVLDAGDPQYLLLTGEPGAGKTSLLAGMARDRPEWLRYFIRSDSTTPLAGGDVQSFLLSIGHQLAQVHPQLFVSDQLEVVVRQRAERIEPGGSMVGIRIEDLTVSPFHRQAVLTLAQDVVDVAGSVVGIEVAAATLEPRLLEPDNLAHLALIDPALALLEEQPGATIVVLVDALDELAASTTSNDLLEWLARGPGLPPNVRVILSSRPSDRLARLRTARAATLHELHIDPASPQVGDDLLEFAGHVLAAPSIAAAVEREGMVIDDVVARAVRRAAGNFLYLSAYARALVDAVDAGSDLLPGLLAFSDVPAGLGDLYAFFVAAIRDDIARLQTLEIRDPVSAQDARTPAWEGVGQPILGVLTVARDALTVEQIAALAGLRVWPRDVSNVVARMRWVLDVRAGRIAFFHASIGEFLSGELAGADWTVDRSQCHERVVRAYRGDAPTWADVNWEAVDAYGLVHLATHLSQCRPQVAGTIDGLICAALRLAIRRRLGTERHFTQLVDVVAEHVIATRPFADALPGVVLAGAVRRRLFAASHSLAPAVLGLMARMGATDEAIEHVLALSPSQQQIEALREVLEHAPEEQIGPRRRELAELEVEMALTHPGTHDGVWTMEDTPDEAVRRAACRLAPYDLPRALRLWERVRGGWTVEITPLEDVYRSAVAACDVDIARGIVAGMPEGQARAYLDLAERAPESDLPGLLDLAEAALSAATPRWHSVCRARLAAARASRDPSRCRSHLGRIVAEAGAATGESGDLVPAFAEAAAILADLDPATARGMLAHVERAEINGLIDDAMLDAARVWLRLGERDRCRALLDRVHAWNDTSWTALRVADVLASFDPPAAARLADGVRAQLGPPAAGGGMMASLMRDGERTALALYLAPRDADAAESVARELPAGSWSSTDRDRLTTLARIAHVHLDAGRRDRAQRLLDEALLAARRPAPLRSEHPSVNFRRGEPEPTPEQDRRVRMDFEEHVVERANAGSDWSWQCERLLFCHPEDVVRAVLPGPAVLRDNPFSWARCVRAFAERIAPEQPDEAIGLVHRVADPAERAIGFAALLAAAPDDAPPEHRQLLWDELDEALGAIEPLEWIHENDDDGVFAYLRPDHRARFEAAVRLLDADPDSALALVEDVEYLRYVFIMAFSCWASDTHVARIASEAQVAPVVAGVHDKIVKRGPAPGDDEIAGSITRAHVLANEAIFDGGRPGPAPVDHPVYAVLTLALAARRGVVPAANVVPAIRGLIETQLPIAAALTAVAAGPTAPADRDLCELAREVVAAARAGDPWLRALTLAELLHAPALDLPSLVDEAFAAWTASSGHAPADKHVLARLVPALAAHRPDDTLRLLLRATEEHWPRAMALLEYCAGVAVHAGGARIPLALHTSLVESFRCTSAPGTALPETIDGVWTG